MILKILIFLIFLFKPFDHLPLADQPSTQGPIFQPKNTQIPGDRLDYYDYVDDYYDYDSIETSGAEPESQTTNSPIHKNITSFSKTKFKSLMDFVEFILSPTFSTENTNTILNPIAKIDNQRVPTEDFYDLIE